MRASAAAIRQSIERDTEYADTLVQRMRDDEESDWPDRVLSAMSAAPLTAREPSLREPWRTEAQPLTVAEVRALGCMAAGMTREMTADVLGVSTETVKVHLVKARRVLRAKNTTHACCLALRQGLIA